MNSSLGILPRHHDPDPEDPDHMVWGKSALNAILNRVQAGKPARFSYTGSSETVLRNAKQLGFQVQMFRDRNEAVYYRVSVLPNSQPMA